MSKDQQLIEETLIKGLSHILRRTMEVNVKDQLAIAQEYKEWINCISNSDFSKEEILVLGENRFN